MNDGDDDDALDRAWWNALPEDVKKRQLELIGQNPFTGRPLSELGLDGAVIVHADGRREPFEGFAMRHEHGSLTAALRASLPEGAYVLNAAGDPVDLVGVRYERRGLGRDDEPVICECGQSMALATATPIAATYRCRTCGKTVIVFEDVNA
jgi:hypothetical protein